MSDLDALETWAAPLLQKLQPRARSQLARTIAQDLRRRQQARIKRQQNPDGTQYAQRRSTKLQDKRGRIRQQHEMFLKLRTARHLRVKADQNGATVGFVGRVARIARVHQYGLFARPDASSRPLKYSHRELLGLTEADRKQIQAALLDHLAL